MDEGSLYQELDRAGNASKRYGMGSGSRGGFGGLGDRSSSGTMGGFGGFGDRSSSGSLGGFDSLNDGMSEMLGNVARNNIELDDDDEDFEFRPDVDFRQGSTYTVRVRRSLVHQCIVS